MKADSYIPALSHDWLTPLYDKLIGWTMPEATFKRHLIKQATIQNGHRILDVGCGTATLTLMIKKTHPEAIVVGVDGDANILRIAKGKAARADLDITLDEAMGFDLPYPTGTFDRVVSSLMFHHLTRTNKIATLREINRVLRTDGELHIADFGQPHNLLMRAASFPWQVFDGFKTTSDKMNGLLPKLIQDAGFVEVHKSADYMTLFGTLSLYSAQKV
jgi:cyclopropane fatty-acyl-phospholipid synthase-like methyltransferase